MEKDFRESVGSLSFPSITYLQIVYFLPFLRKRPCQSHNVPSEVLSDCSDDLCYNNPGDDY